MNYPSIRKSAPRKHFIGDKYVAKNGSPFTLIKKEGSIFYFQYDNTDIVFNMNCSNFLRDLKNNQIKDLITNKDGTINPIIFESSYKEYVGTTYKMNDGSLIKVLDYKFPDAVVEFVGFEEYGSTILNMQAVKNGLIKSPFIKNNDGGFLGLGMQKGQDTYKSKAYKLWRSMLRRTNQSLVAKGREISKLSECYIGVKVCPEWYCYYNFFCWYNQFTSTIYMDDSINFQLDKDLLYPFYKDKYMCKYYSPETCVIIPEEINKSIVIPKLHKENNHLSDNDKRMYKLQKELRIRDLANYYRSINAINDFVYSLLINFTVENYM